MEPRLKSLPARMLGGMLTYMLLQSTAVAEDIGGIAIGINPILEVSCENLSNPQNLMALANGSHSWDCTSSGLVADAGDTILQTVSGMALDTSFVGAALTGLADVTRVQCDNQTTGQTVNVDRVTLLPTWNCVNSGLAVNPGDVVLQTMEGTAIGTSVSPRPPVQGLTAIAGDGEVTLTWMASPDAQHYLVYSSINPIFVISPENVVGETMLPEFVHEGLINGMMYFYAVEAINGEGEISLSDLVSAVPTDATFNHVPVDNEACETCHNGVIATGKPANHSPTEDSCDACHTTEHWITVIGIPGMPPVYPQPPVIPEPPVSPEPPVIPEPPVMPEPPVDPQPPVDPEPPVIPEPPVDPQPPVNPEPPVIPEPPVDPRPPVAPEPPVIPEPPVDPQPPVNPEPPVMPEPPVDPQPPVDPEPPVIAPPTNPGIPPMDAAQ